MKGFHNRNLTEQTHDGRRLTAVFCIVLFCVSSVYAPSGGPYDLNWTTIDGGGGLSTGGPYSLSGTIGQPDASYSAGGSYEVLGGYWPGGALCFVEFADFARFADYWLVGDSGADLDGDADVDFADVRELADLWLGYCPSGWPLR